MSGWVTGMAAGAVLLVFLLCLRQEHKPRVLGQVNLLPTVPIMILCVVLLLGLLAHAISLLTGQTLTGQLAPPATISR